MAGWIDAAGRRPNIDWQFTAKGSPLISVDVEDAACSSVALELEEKIDHLVDLLNKIRQSSTARI